LTATRRPPAGFWITVARVAVLVGYPLSFGPACSITSRAGIMAPRRLPTVYRPLIWGLSPYATVRNGGLEMNHGPIGSALRWYARLGAADDSWDWWFLNQSDGTYEWEWTPPHFGTSH
jgi:hypothetical protein